MKKKENKEEKVLLPMKIAFFELGSEWNQINRLIINNKREKLSTMKIKIISIQKNDDAVNRFTY